MHSYIKTRAKYELIKTSNTLKNTTHIHRDKFMDTQENKYITSCKSNIVYVTSQTCSVRSVLTDCS